jgi:hypothetical protein
LQLGRTNNPLPGYSSKPILFIKKDHPHRELRSGAEVVKAYQAAQTLNADGLVKAQEQKVKELVEGNDEDTEEVVAVKADIENNSNEAI